MSKIGERILQGRKIVNAEFPRDLPMEAEEHVIVIVCESDCINWSFHDGSKFDFAPSVFWITPHVQVEDRSPPPCMSLTRFLCKHALSYVFGGIGLNSATKESASRAATRRKVPEITVYLMSNSSKAEEDISFLFQDVPARLFRLRNTNFFTTDQMGVISKPLVSVGQFAAMYAAHSDHGAPTLLLNGGSAITYMGIDKECKFLGGGACPGMSIRCRSLFDYCSKDFPPIDYGAYQDITERARRENKPISIFASNLEIGIAANATAELAGQLRNIVKQFLKTIGPTDKPVAVVITGDDTHTLEQLLRSDCSSMVETEPDVGFPSPKKVAFCVRKNIVPYGVQSLLASNRRKRPPLDPDAEIRESFLGIRGASVAKKANGARVVRRGSVSQIVHGRTLEEDTFVLLLDEGRKVSLDFVQMYDALKLYVEVGEETREENKEGWAGEKREASTKVQENLETGNSKIRERKLQLDAGKRKEGSVLKTLCPEDKPKQKNKKRPRPEATPVKEAKKAKKKEKKENPRRFIGQRIAKFFEAPTVDNPDHQELYFGIIDNYSNANKLWHILYDDDDQEEFDLSEIRNAIILYSNNKKGDPK